MTAASAGISWIVLVLASIGGVLVAIGAFEPGSSLHDVGLFWGGLLFIGAVWQGWRVLREEQAEQHLELVSGLMLWTAFIWIVFRLGALYAPQLVLLPAALVALLTAVYPWRVFVFPLVMAFLMEGGLVATGHQPVLSFAVNMGCYAGAAVGLGFSASSKVYRERLRLAKARAKKKDAAHEYARDLGLTDRELAIGESRGQLFSFDESDRQHSESTVELITSSFELQLELVRQCLGLTTVAVLWPDPAHNTLRLRSLATTRKDIAEGPYPLGSGITGALTGPEEEVAMAPVRQSFTGLPYYKNQGGVGSIFALRIPDEGESAAGFGGKKISAVLCVDREDESAWSEEERHVLRLAAQKLSVDVKMGRRFQLLNQERSAIQYFCDGMRELNAVLGLEQVLTATVKAVEIVVPANLIAVSLVEGNSHRIVRAEGGQAERLAGKEFPKDEGLVGQVLKINRSLPAKAECYGPTPVFSNDQRLSGFNSLLVVPLRKEKGEPVGTLTLAVTESGAFTKSRQALLELIADQVAIKIDLGRAHEQINKMATTDGLTELTNHRTFQHGFDIMMQRAQRRKSPLCLVLCDIDHFKQINDQYGHPFGDKVLKGVATVLKREARAVDLAARYGGEEFAVILEDSDADGGYKMAERIRHEVGKLAFYRERDLVKISMSFGLAAYPADGEEKSALIAKADQALYQAKHDGRNCTVIWSKRFSSGEGH